MQRLGLRQNGSEMHRLFFCPLCLSPSLSLSLSLCPWSTDWYYVCLIKITIAMCMSVTAIPDNCNISTTNARLNAPYPPHIAKSLQLPEGPGVLAAECLGLHSGMFQPRLRIYYWIN